MIIGISPIPIYFPSKYRKSMSIKSLPTFLSYRTRRRSALSVNLGYRLMTLAYWSHRGVLRNISRKWLRDAIQRRPPTG